MEGDSGPIQEKAFKGSNKVFYPRVYSDTDLWSQRTINDMLAL